MNNNYRYQFLFIGNRETLYNEIVQGLKESFSELKIPEESLYYSINDVSEIKGNQPIVIVVGHDEPHLPQQYKDWIGSNEFNVNAILPVYYDNFSDDYKDDILTRYNGIRYDTPNAIVNTVLEGFNLFRKQRKLFISYRRKESREVATQLYAHFQERNFDVFLDTNSIARGVEFQKNLFHKMMDCDTVLLLDTKDFLNSKYCREELEKAIANRIGILRIKWPNSVNPAYSGLIDIIDLKRSDFKGRILRSTVLDNLNHRVESLRVRSLASRQDALTTEFIETAYRKRKTAVQIYPNIIRMYEQGNTHIFIAAIGIPTSESFHNAERLLGNLLDGKAEFTLIYDDLSLLQSWINHLCWLSERTNLKILRKSEFESEL